MSVFAKLLLSQVKMTLREAGNTFDTEIESYIDGCRTDLQNAGIHHSFFMPSSIDWEVDAQILQACRWYALSKFGLYNTDMEKYANSYQSLKATLATQNYYTTGNNSSSNPEQGCSCVSPTISVSSIDGGHRISITDVKGTQSFDIMDGSAYVLTDEDIEKIAEKVHKPLYRHDIEFYDLDTGVMVYFTVINHDSTNYTSELEYDVNEGYIGSHPQGVYNFLPNDSTVQATGQFMADSGYVLVHSAFRYGDTVTVAGVDWNGSEVASFELGLDFGDIYDKVTEI